MKLPSFRQLALVLVALGIAYFAADISSDGLDLFIGGLLIAGTFAVFVGWLFTKSPALRDKAKLLWQGFVDFLSGLN
jgi:hypothetical protein